MLVIRPEQMGVFSRSLEETFKEKLARHLEWYLAGRGVAVGEDELRRQIDRGLAQCDEFGMDRQCDVARLFEIVCGARGGFGEGELPIDALRILYTYKMDPELKLKRLQAWVETSGWTGA